MVIYIYNIKYTWGWKISLICKFFIVQAMIPQVSKPSQRHISLGLRISVHWLPATLPSFLYSEHYLSSSNLFQCSTFSCCPRFFSFLHQYVTQHNPALLSHKMASTHWNINCFQNTTTPVSLTGVVRACDITRSILIRTTRSREQLKLLWLKQLCYQVKPLHRGHCCGFLSQHKPGFGWADLLCIANQSWSQWKHSFNKYRVKCQHCTKQGSLPLF